MPQIINTFNEKTLRLNAIKSPDELYGQLFVDVQKNHIFSDDKTFLDMIPNVSAEYINNRYVLEKESSSFYLSDFIDRFFLTDEPLNNQQFDGPINVEGYIESGWKKLECSADDDRGSLLALPNKYIVPGGRFKEQFYWDSYFIMLGLAADNKWEMIEGMIENVAHMIDRFGFVPTANRTYFISRSQPPFFASMIELLATKKGDEFVIKYLPYLVSEYEFWMKGSYESIAIGQIASNRVVMMPGGEILNRYYDNKCTPRPEAISGDNKTAAEATWRNSSDVYLNLRAAAESGWDFSSRWFDDPANILTIQTIDIIPVDLNCLIYQMELAISKLYRLTNNLDLSKKFELLASKRVNALQHYCWDENEGFYSDYNFVKNKKTGRLTLAAVFPLYSKISTQQQADLVALRLERDFLKQGGLVTTLCESGHQWDKPNGWAPLEWIAIEGLHNYGHNELAEEIKNRWISTNVNGYNVNGILVEKYNVEDIDQPSTCGEYILQQGFGWTNGVFIALSNKNDTQ